MHTLMSESPGPRPRAAQASSRPLFAGASCAAAALIAALALALAAPAARAEADLSNPKSAALAFAKAVEDGDLAAAKAASVGTDKDYEFVRHMSNFFTAVKQFKQAAQKKFGDDARLPAELDEGMHGDFEKREAKVEGDKATLVRPGAPDEHHPPALKKVEGSWKFDLPSIRQDPAFAAIESAAPKMAPAVKKVTEQVEAGQYKTANEAVEALFKAMEGASSSGEKREPTPPDVPPAPPKA